MTIADNHVKECLQNAHYDTELYSHNNGYCCQLPILCSDHFCVALATASQQTQKCKAKHPSLVKKGEF